MDPVLFSHALWTTNQRLRTLWSELFFTYFTYMVVYLWTYCTGMSTIYLDFCSSKCFSTPWTNFFFQIVPPAVFLGTLIIAEFCFGPFIADVFSTVFTFFYVFKFHIRNIIILLGKNILKFANRQAVFCFFEFKRTRCSNF